MRLQSPSTDSIACNGDRSEAARGSVRKSCLGIPYESPKIEGKGTTGDAIGKDGLQRDASVKAASTLIQGIQDKGSVKLC